MNLGVEQDLCCNEPAPSFLKMMSVPEAGTMVFHQVIKSIEEILFWI